MNSEKDKLNVKREWRTLNNRLDIFTKSKSNTINLNFGFFVRVAAVILIVFGLGWSTEMITESLSEKEQIVHQLEVPKGQRSKLILADGTEVWLNSDSKLDFAINKESKERIVNLEGEAFFHVARDEKKPFIVRVKGQELKVLGTTFNVRSYWDEESVYTTLEEGSVEIKAGGRTVILEPNQQLEFNRLSNRLSRKAVDTNYYTVWRDGRYVFDNESFSDLIRMVERWYDVQFIYPEDFFEGMHYSGVIKRTMPIEHVLTLINHTTPIRYEMKGDTVIIMPKE
jgi:ferric-dicitrate binding protein FerR (iron transport regulator)